LGASSIGSSPARQSAENQLVGVSPAGDGPIEPSARPASSPGALTQGPPPGARPCQGARGSAAWVLGPAGAALPQLHPSTGLGTIPLATGPKSTKCRWLGDGHRHSQKKQKARPMTHAHQRQSPIHCFCKSTFVPKESNSIPATDSSRPHVSSTLPACTIEEQSLFWLFSVCSNRPLFCSLKPSATARTSCQLSKSSYLDQTNCSPTHTQTILPLHTYLTSRRIIVGISNKQEQRFDSR
jgi:hypothetical protein